MPSSWRAYCAPTFCRPCACPALKTKHSGISPACGCLPARISRRARHRLKSFLLAHGVRYTGSANWGEAHRRWLGRCSFPSAWQHLALDEHRHTIEDRLAQCAGLETALREAVISRRFYPVVLALQAMRGIQFVTAVGMVSEVGDLSRFEHSRQLMARLGVTSSEHSSGGKRRQGGITKTGNSYARRLLVGAAWSYCYPARVSPEIQGRLEGLPKATIDHGWDAQVRLSQRFRRLTARGKPINITVVAVARELAAFIWDISRLAMSLAIPRSKLPAACVLFPEKRKEFSEGGAARHPSNPRWYYATGITNLRRKLAAGSSGDLCNAVANPRISV
ncbi:hypothetical protein R69746_08074 [Paraburkholderia aspalathi]|nr:hypothetical protein R69746_08074 [Paraburkholderia aspalathi]CAE6870411.1 hypothetical protein R75465_08246 [Paraburkholderia aspalathi]